MRSATWKRHITTSVCQGIIFSHMYTCSFQTIPQRPAGRFLCYSIPPMVPVVYYEILTSEHDRARPRKSPMSPRGLALLLSGLFPRRNLRIISRKKSLKNVRASVLTRSGKRTMSHAGQLMSYTNIASV